MKQSLLDSNTKSPNQKLSQWIKVWAKLFDIKQEVLWSKVKVTHSKFKVTGQSLYLLITAKYFVMTLWKKVGQNQIRSRMSKVKGKISRWQRSDVEIMYPTEHGILHLLSNMSNIGTSDKNSLRCWSFSVGVCDWSLNTKTNPSLIRSTNQHLVQLVVKCRSCKLLIKVFPKQMDAKPYKYGVPGLLIISVLICYLKYAVCIKSR